MSRELRLACGPQGLALNVPSGVDLRVPRPLRETAGPLAGSPREVLRAALQNPVDGLAWERLVSGRRRVAVLVGHLPYPAPYPLVLPELCRALVESGVRPTRISFLCCPGAGGPVLGRFAIRRYGEDTVGEHLVRAWESRDPVSADPLFEAADLKVAVFSSSPEISESWPPGSTVDLALAVSPGHGPVQRVARVRAGSLAAVFPPEAAAPDAAGARGAAPGPEGSGGVFLTTGGGDPTDATLEESLLGLRDGTARARFFPAATTVLAFGGAAGLGSARFTLGLWEVLRNFEFPNSGAVNVPPQAETPLQELWTPLQALERRKRLVLFSPGLAEHAEGDELREVLAQSPRLGQVLSLVETEPALWARLESVHGARYSIDAEPLGWRGACV